ncbi:heme NO-binding domain-containing protein [Pontibacter pamirensis]|uniref:heme NO-binding domain-containing protein n=1 Tax=Pontibacter pamirensis TaxID=2562824 RepID=UPI00138962D9|nr:heme NO-binding domain-containing protein [Pontibacter pamirensis]
MEDNIIHKDRMHGSIFVLLKRFVESLYGYSTWVNLLEAAGIKHAPYQMDETYPTGEIAAIVGKASELMRVPPHQLMEQYGESLVPDLLLVYKKHMRPEWRTYDMLLNTEAAMHAAVREKDSRATPPLLLVTKKGSRQLIVDYHSKRRMAAVAVGIIKGIAKYYDESDKVEVTLLTPVGEERVQISVDFLL